MDSLSPVPPAKSPEESKPKPKQSLKQRMAAHMGGRSLTPIDEALGTALTAKEVQRIAKAASSPEEDSKSPSRKLSIAASSASASRGSSPLTDDCESPWFLETQTIISKSSRECSSLTSIGSSGTSGSYFCKS